ncbi:conserved hypothetical protein [Ricinus communis]|uniref:Uncharacterized protein n=1 Tax=Ricinus communis TaxID=3988 RepID=B9SE54_RICCO|nr:conserved hypothetical protein [Ricinus communis]
MSSKRASPSSIKPFSSPKTKVSRLKPPPKVVSKAPSAVPPKILKVLMLLLLSSTLSQKTHTSISSLSQRILSFKALKENFDTLTTMVGVAESAYQRALRAQVVAKEARLVELLAKSEKLKIDYEAAFSKVVVKGQKLKADYPSIKACNEELEVA